MKFEDLVAWKEARTLVRCVYELTRDETPKRDFGLCSQIRRHRRFAIIHLSREMRSIFHWDHSSFIKRHLAP